MRKISVDATLIYRGVTPWFEHAYGLSRSTWAALLFREPRDVASPLVWVAPVAGRKDTWVNRAGATGSPFEPLVPWVPDVAVLRHGAPVPALMCLAAQYWEGATLSMPAFRGKKQSVLDSVDKFLEDAGYVEIASSLIEMQLNKIPAFEVASKTPRELVLQLQGLFRAEML